MRKINIIFFYIIFLKLFCCCFFKALVVSIKINIKKINISHFHIETRFTYVFAVITELSNRWCYYNDYSKTCTIILYTISCYHHTCVLKDEKSLIRNNILMIMILRNVLHYTIYTTLILLVYFNKHSHWSEFYF